MKMLKIAVAAGALALFAGCAATGPGGAPGPVVDAPSVKVGDRWVYRGVDGYRAPVRWDETHEVTALGPQGITVRITGKGNTLAFERTEIWSAPGIVLSGAVYDSETDRFDPPLVRYQFPLTPGETWSQSLRDRAKDPGPYGPIQRYVTVGGYETVTTPAGTFNAIKMRIFMQLDDETFWRYPTQCNYLVWYAPAVGGMVREEQRSYYREKEGIDSGTVPGQNATIELVAYTLAPR